MKNITIILFLCLASSCAVTGYYRYVFVGDSMQHEIDSTVQCYDIHIKGTIPKDILSGTEIQWVEDNIMMIWDIPNKKGDEAIIYLNPKVNKRINRELLKHFVGHLILMRKLGITSYDDRTRWMENNSLCMTDLTDCQNQRRLVLDHDPARGCYEL